MALIWIIVSILCKEKKEYFLCRGKKQVSRSFLYGIVCPEIKIIFFIQDLEVGYIVLLTNIDKNNIVNIKQINIKKQIHTSIRVCRIVFMPWPRYIKTYDVLMNR